jgi:hypothetical protein
MNPKITKWLFIAILSGLLLATGSVLCQQDNPIIQKPFEEKTTLVGVDKEEIKEPPATPQEKEIIVYITRTGKKYHRAGCRYLKKSKIPITLKEAKRRGYTPCKVCKPPE